MSHKKQIHQFIKSKIKEGIPKKQIATELASQYQKKEYKKLLENFPEPALKAKYKLLNNILIASIIVVTLFKVLTIIVISLDFSIAVLPIFLIAGLAIPILLITLIRSGQATGYLVTALLTFASLKGLDELPEVFTSGDPIVIGLAILHLLLIFTIIFLSIFLLRKIHPDYKLFSK